MLNSGCRWLLLTLLLVAGAAGQTTTTVTGTIKDLAQNVVTSGLVTFELRPGVDTTISGNARFVPTTITCSITNVGQLQSLSGGACVVTQNTAIQPAGTYYLVTLEPNFVPTSKFNWYAVGGSQDITTVVPTPATSPAYTFADTVSNQSIGGWKTFVDGISAKNVLQVRVADPVIWGGDLGAAINASLADFGAAPACGTVFIPSGTYTVSTQILVGARNGCRFIAGGVGSTVLHDGIAGAPANSMWKVSDSSDLVFDGMTLVGASATGNLMELEGSGSEGRVILRNIRFTSTTGTGKDSAGATMGAAGLYVRNYAGPLEIDSGTLFDYNAQGLVIDNTSNGLTSALNTSHIFGASFLFQTGDGIKFVGGTASVGFSIKHSNFESNGGYGINDPAGVSAFVYEGNYFEKNSAGDINETGSDFGGKIVSNRFLRQNTSPSIVVSTTNSAKASGIKIATNLFQATTSSTLTLPEFIVANFADSSITNNVYDPFTGVIVSNATVLGAGSSNVAYGGNLNASFDGGTISNDLSDPNGAAVANFLGKLEQSGNQVATLAGAETLANKTLTSPLFNGGAYQMQADGAAYGFSVRASDYGTNQGSLIEYKQAGLSTAAHIYAADGGGYVPFDIDSLVVLNRGASVGTGQSVTGGTLNPVAYQISGNAGQIVFTGSLTTSAATSDNVPVSPGLTASSHCSLTATNSTAAGMTGVYVSAKNSPAGDITVAHPATAGATFDVLCTAN